MSTAPFAKTIDLSIEGMTCASCVRRVEMALNKVPGVAQAHVNLATRRAHVGLRDVAVDPQALAAAVERKGYEARVLAEPGQERTSQFPEDGEPGTSSGDLETRLAWRRWVMAAVMTLPLFLYEMGGHALGLAMGMPVSRPGLPPAALAWAELVLCTGVLVFPGRLFFSRGLKALRHLGPDMNTLVALGAGSAWAYSVVVTVAPHWLPADARHLYFEAAAVVVTLILLGRWLEARAKGRANTAIQHLLSLRPRTAQVRRGREWQTVPADDLQVGDEVLVKPGEHIPMDGEVIQGESWVDESMVTGESAPVRREQGDPVIGGTLNTQGSLVLSVTRVGADTVLAGIVRLVEQAQGGKLPIQSRVDQVTAWFVPAVMVLAVAAFIAWWLWGPAPQLTHALVAGVAVLIIACPCAMGLATPISIMVATGRAAGLGLIFREGEALQRLRGVRIVAFDKTGTLTLGKPSLTDVQPADEIDRDTLLLHMAAAQSHSEHPIGRAIVDAAQALPSPIPAASGFSAVPGGGVTAVVAGHQYLIGSPKLMRDHAVVPTGEQQAQLDALAAQGKTPFFIARDGGIVGSAAVADTVRPSARRAIARLHELGLATAMVTGDHESTARAIAAELGIDIVHAGTTPERKVERLNQLKEQAGTLAFVGDGINDAPALASADVGMAMAQGTDAAIASSSIVLMNGDLESVPRAVSLSRLTLRNISQNLFWAFGYNVALIPVAAGALYGLLGVQLSPMLGAAAMALSSVFVVTNALRLKWLSLDGASVPAKNTPARGSLPVS